jgi:hypothetical protein
MPGQNEEVRTELVRIVDQLLRENPGAVQAFKDVMGDGAVSGQWLGYELEHHSEDLATIAAGAPVPQDGADTLSESLTDDLSEMFLAIVAELGAAVQAVATEQGLPAADLAAAVGALSPESVAALIFDELSQLA